MTTDHTYLIARLRELAARKWPDAKNQTHSLFGQSADAIEAQAARIAELEAERDAAVADAERYQWLRHGDNDEQCIKFSKDCCCGYDDVWLARGAELDAAIDAALEKS